MVHMTIHSPSPGVLETAVTDADLTERGISTHASRGEDAPALSKQVMKAWRRAMKAGKARDAKSRQICAVQRAKREGTDLLFDPVTSVVQKVEVQTSLNDF